MGSRTERLRTLGPEPCPCCETLVMWQELVPDKYAGTEAHVCGHVWKAVIIGPAGQVVDADTVTVDG